jgi:tRNA uridine 5-carboxymethylaminomethyl modification enzyme
MVDYDVIVVGGGHAGVEAALAVARMGKTAVIVTMDPAKLALMSCNPAIGGIGKSQLVKELDALGGLMGQAIDATGIQFRRLNLSRGAAVWSTRAQADRIAYNQYVVDFVAAQDRVEVIEGVAGAIVVDQGRAVGVRLESGEDISAHGVVVASGTFLGGLIHIGEKKIKAGRMGDKAAYSLSEDFAELGFEVGRLKTGTPPRLDGSTIDYSKCELQPGEKPIPLLSFRSEPREFDQTPCHLTRTSAATKKLVSANFQKSPIFSGQINSTGPRYCPSIEDKFHRFADKESHHVFLEPEGNGTDEVYPNGFSTALPEEIQREAIRTIVGLEEAEITRPGYAVEYDYCPAHQIDRSLETRRIKGLFFAGQINGTSGYEEAAAQGLMAGVNAVLGIEGEPPFILDRSEAYIGVMIDDLTTRSTTEPYRMFTSRAEYRLALREDNARDRLFEYARGYRLIDEADFESFRTLSQDTDQEIKKYRATRIRVSELGELGVRLARKETASVADLLKQPGVTLDDVSPILQRFEGMFNSNREVRERAAIQIRYKGYIDKQGREIEKFKRQEKEFIPDDFSYHKVPGLKAEAKEKLARFRPSSLGQASRLEGITPGDLSVLAVGLKRHKAKAS